MRDLEHARLVLAAAGKDLKAVEGMVSRDVFAEEIFGFHAQQVVEKAVKAWLSICGITYPRIHDLEELFALLSDKVETIPDQFLSLTELTEFAVQFRYEAYDEGAQTLDRSAIVARVSDLVRHVQSLLI